jgi:microcystin degradation protein MlrC
MPRILVAECMQEISTFNPVPSHLDDFEIHHGDDMLAFHTSVQTDVCGALEVFGQRDDIQVVPSASARATTSGGVLDAQSFATLNDTLIGAIRANAANIDAFYFCLHGAMSAQGELDPEGFLLEQARQILGPDIPIVISLDMHGIFTDRMSAQINGVTLYHTYPHVDMADCGARAARLLLGILDQGLKPVIARVIIPTLVRGDELITASGVFGESIRQSQAIEKEAGVLAAGMMIGNPFTDVPELCSQAVVVTNSDAKLAAKHAQDLAGKFWPHRARMQAQLCSLDEAIDGAEKADGPVIFTDAADATSSGASGDSLTMVARLLERGYTGTVLAPLVDPAAVEKAVAAGIGASRTFKLGGALDPKRFMPIELEMQVDMLSRGEIYFESWNNWFNAGPTAVLKTDTLTLVVTTRPIHLFDRSLFLYHGQDPRRFDVIVVKSPHCQPQFFDEWAESNFNIDVPGSTSANLASLGHTICARPLYPLDEGVEFVPAIKLFPTQN